MDDSDQRLGVRIGAGRTAEVYAQPDGTVVKLLRPEFGGLATAEEAIANWLSRSSIDAPRLLATTAMAGRVGLVFEHVGGPSMQERLVQRPWELRAQASLLAKLHVGMHASSGVGLPHQREAFRELIDSGAEFLPAGGRERALSRLATLPDGRSLCHGDLHPGNVRLAARGPIAVDWTAATCGEPAADIARTVFLLRHALVPRASGRVRQVLVTVALHRLLAAYLRQYRRLRPVSQSELDAWWLVVLASRIGKRDEAERPLLTRLILRELSRPD